MVRTLKRAGVLMLPLALTSCALPLPQVDDIAVTGVEFVQRVPAKDHDGPYRDVDGPFLRLTFNTRRDFQKLAHDWNYTLAAVIASCTGDDLDTAKPLAIFGGVYDKNGSISMYDKRTTSGPSPRYHLYVAVRAEPNLDVDTGHPQPDYDLKAHPRDICVRIVGQQEVDGDGWGFAKFKSNIARVTKDAIAKASR